MGVKITFFPSTPHISVGTSTKFSEAEIKAAMAVVEKSFASSKEDKTLRWLWYNEAESNDYIATTHKNSNNPQHPDKDTIYLRAWFSVGSSGKPGPLSPNSYHFYKGWQLVRDDAGTWTIVNGGEA